MHNADGKQLFEAVSRAMDHTPDLDEASDRLMIHKGCCILNSWGYGPYYHYRYDIRGPYSKELAEDLMESRHTAVETSIVSQQDVERLSEILSKGEGYVEAYSEMVLMRGMYPDVGQEYILNRMLELWPELKDEVLEAYTCLVQSSWTHTSM